MAPYASGGASGLPFFYALQPRWVTLDRFYKVYVAPSALCGAWVAGQVYDEETAAIYLNALQILGLFFRGVMARKLERRRRLELEYDAMDPLGQGFLDKDPRNFRLESQVIEVMRIEPGRSLWTAGAKNSGRLRIRTRQGPSWKLLLPGEVDPAGLKGLLDRVGPVELTSS